MHAGRDVGDFAFRWTAGEAPDESLTVRPVGVEQSNTSIVFGNELIMKAIRRIEPGVNPELELLRFLTARGFPHIAALKGWYEVDGRHVSATLGILQEFLAGAHDGWELTLDELATDPEGLLDRVEDLGVVIGELHTALGSDNSDPDFAPVEPSAESLSILYADVDEQIERVFLDLPDTEATAPIQGRGQDVREKLSLLAHATVGGRVIRTHGDLHLGQTMLSSRGWVVLDFEGEPARPLPERRLKRSPLRDVAGMLRSFSYATAGCQAPARARGAGRLGGARARTLPGRVPPGRGQRPAAPGPAGHRAVAGRLRAGEGRLRVAIRAEQPTRLGRDPGRRDPAAPGIGVKNR